MNDNVHHTLDPWVTERDRDPPHRPDIATVAWVDDWCVGIHTPGFPGGNYRDAEYGATESDARLIAAAPDLLAALQRALNVLDATGAQDDANAARAAIAKALARPRKSETGAR